MTSWRIRWGFAALAALRAMPLRQAERVDAAVLRLATRNEGKLAHVPDIHPFGGRLYVGEYVVFLTLNEAESELVVWYVYRRR